MPYIEQGPDGIKFGVDLEEILEAIKRLFVGSTPHINYDFGFIKGMYAKEQNWLTVETVRGEVTAPYTLLFDYRDRAAESSWGRVTVIAPYQFPGELQAHKEAMVAKFIAVGKLEKGKGNRQCPRVHSVEIKANDAPDITVQKAFYFDQVGTNLTPDEPLQPPLEGSTVSKSVRSWDLNQANCHQKLPTLSDSRLANTIGVAVGITAVDKYGRSAILRRKRTKKVAIYEGQWHVPFSFALAWNENLRPGETLDLRQLIDRDYGHEFGQELPGLEITDFAPPRPLALCRDMVRAGKPQFFFEIKSRIPLEELQRRIRPDAHEYKGKTQVTSEKSGDLSPELVAYSLLVRRDGQLSP